MRKNELIHLHALLRTLTDRLIETGTVDDEDLAAYHSIGISPMSLQASRDDHEAAVLLLGGVLAAAVATGEATTDDVTTDDVTTDDGATTVDEETQSDRQIESTDDADATESPVR